MREPCSALPRDLLGLNNSTLIKLAYDKHHPLQVGMAIMKKMNLQGQAPEDAAAAFAGALFRNWGVGDSECGNGAVLLLSLEDRQVHPSQF